MFNLFKWLVLGGGMCQYDDNIAPYLEVTKSCYKDLINVAKDPDSGEIAPTTLVFRVSSVTGSQNTYLKCMEHPQNFFYVLVDPQSWHVTLLHNSFRAGW